MQVFKHGFVAGTFLAMFLAGAAYGDPKVDEQVFGPVVQGAKYALSPCAGHLAVAAAKGSRMVVTVDGVAGPKVDEVITPVTAWVDPRPFGALSAREQKDPWNRPQAVTFSGDGSHFAYVGRVGQEWVVFEDHKDVLHIPAVGLVGAATGIGGNAGNTDIRLQFAPADGKHLFFATSGFAGYELWVDGQKMPGYYQSGGSGTEGTADPLITGDGAHFAYVAAMGTHPGDKRALVIDGKEAAYLATNLQYTQDDHLVGIVRDAKEEHLYVDGKPRFDAQQIIGVYAGPTGGRIAAVLRHTNPNGSIGQFVLIDGKPAEATLCDQVKQVIFSPDGKRYAAVCGRAGAQWIVLDGKKGEEYQFIDQSAASLSSGPAFSPDSSKFAYVANANGKKFIVINDDESDGYDNNAQFVFSPEGKHIVTLGAQQGGRWLLNIDGKTTQVAGNRGMDFASFQFSPDQTRYGYCVAGSPNSGGAVYVDGKDTGLAGNFNFSPDSKHVAITGYRAADNARGLFVDGTLVYAAPQSVFYRAFSPDGNHLYWTSLEPLKTPTATDAFEVVTFADGKAVAHSDRGAAIQAILFPYGFAQLPTAPPTWSVGADGTLTTFTAADDVIKRIKVTPDPDMTLQKVLQSSGGRKK